MSTKERVIHAIIFELFALLLVVPLVIGFTGKGVADVAIISLGLSLYTVIWNYVYNIGFDNRFGHQRISRSMGLRVLHSVGFEAGLILVSVPMIAWFLQLSFLAAFMLEAVFLVVFFFYAIIFNWLYDWSRSRWY